MKKFLLMMLLLAVPVMAQEGSFSVNLDIINGNVSLYSVDLFDAVPDKYVSDENDEMIARVMSFRGEELFNYTFSKRSLVFTATIPPGDKFINFMFPDYREAKEIVITNTDTNEVELVVDLTDYQLCNFDEFCDSDETEETCPEDCSFKEVVEVIVAEEEEVEEAVAEEVVKEEEIRKEYLLLMIVAGLVFIALIVYIIRKGKRKI